MASWTSGENVPFLGDTAFLATGGGVSSPPSKSPRALGCAGTIRFSQELAEEAELRSQIFIILP